MYICIYVYTHYGEDQPLAARVVAVGDPRLPQDVVQDLESDNNNNNNNNNDNNNNHHNNNNNNSKGPGGNKPTSDNGADSLRNKQ